MCWNGGVEGQLRAWGAHSIILLGHRQPDSVLTVVTISEVQKKMCIFCSAGTLG